MNLKIHVLLSLAGLIFGTLAAVALVFWLNSEEAALGGLWTESLIFFAVFVVLAFFFFSRPALYLKALSPQISSFDDGTEYAKSSGETNEGIALILLALALPLGEGAAFGMGGLLLIIMTYRRFWRELPPQPLLGAVGLGFLCWIGFGFLATVLSPEGWVRPRELGRLFPFVLFPLVACSVSRLSPSLVKKAAATFIGILGISCLVALIQYFSNLHENTTFMELLGAISTKHQIRAPGQGGRLVAGGFYFHRLKMAHVLLLGASLLAARQVFSQLTSRQRTIEGLLLLLFVSTLFLTYTRAALLGLVGGGVVIIWFASRRWKALTLGVGALVILIALSYSPIRERIFSIGDAAASSERVLLWSTAVNVIDERPWGMGLGNYPSLIGKYYEGVEGAGDLPRTYAHNLLLSSWAESGPFGALGYGWMWVCLALACFWRLRKPEFVSTHFIAAAGLMALIALWTVGITHDVLYHKPVSLTFATFMGAVTGAFYARNPSSSKAEP